MKNTLLTDQNNINNKDNNINQFFKAKDNVEDLDSKFMPNPFFTQNEVTLKMK